MLMSLVSVTHLLSVTCKWFIYLQAINRGFKTWAQGFLPIAFTITKAHTGEMLRIYSTPTLSHWKGAQTWGHTSFPKYILTLGINFRKWKWNHTPLPLTCQVFNNWDIEEEKSENKKAWRQAHRWAVALQVHLVSMKNLGSLAQGDSQLCLVSLIHRIWYAQV